MSQYEAVIFDWAGTTVDYGCFAPVRTFLETFESFGVTATMEETRRPMGMLKRDHIKTMLSMPRIGAQWAEMYGRPFTEEDVSRINAAFEQRLLKVLHDFSTPKPDTLEAVAALRGRGIKIGSTTGYTDQMMAIVAPAAEAQGYAPDFMITPDGTAGQGRPLPYMVFRNMEALNVTSVSRAVKVGDTVSDIREGRSAGLRSIGVIEGSSELGLTPAEWEALSAGQKAEQAERVSGIYFAAGADDVIHTLRELPDLLF